MTSDLIRRLHSVPVAIRVKTENQPSFNQVHSECAMEVRGPLRVYRVRVGLLMEWLVYENHR